VFTLPHVPTVFSEVRLRVDRVVVACTFVAHRNISAYVPRSIGDEFRYNSSSAKDLFLPDQTTRALAERTNTCSQDAVMARGQAYVQHLDGFIVALREELDSPGD
jgi:hypothetical protein